VSRSADHLVHDRAKLDEVRAESLNVLGNLLRGQRKVALLDFPNHQNVGDSMIWLGEEQYLRDLHMRVAYVADVQRYSPELLNKRVPTGPILLHGGGNFGDLWPEFQDFREQVVRDFPERQIIQLPQSIQFRDTQAAARANGVFGGHRGFHLLVRDLESFEKAQRLLPDVAVRFSHDSALGWRPPVGERLRGRTRLVVLARQDHEKGLGIAELARSSLRADDVVIDWGLSGYPAVSWRLARMPLGLARVWPWLKRSSLFYPVVRSAYKRLANLNGRAGIRLFQTARGVATDRLHAHVLAVLLGLPHVIADNSYGKIGGVLRATTSSIGEHRLVTDQEEAEAAFVWLAKQVSMKSAAAAPPGGSS
jgi:exopolysaccharide biosynthesis predicted pyruvyltransferase EpsI